MACLGSLVKLLPSIPQKRHCCAGSLQCWLHPRLIPCTKLFTLQSSLPSPSGCHQQPWHLRHAMNDSCILSSSQFFSFLTSRRPGRAPRALWLRLARNVTWHLMTAYFHTLAGHHRAPPYLLAKDDLSSRCAWPRASIIPARALVSSDSCCCARSDATRSADSAAATSELLRERMQATSPALGAMRYLKLLLQDTTSSQRIQP